MKILLAGVGLAEALAYALIVVSPLAVYRVDVGVNLSLQRAILLLLLGTLVFELARGRRRLEWPSRHAALALLAMLVFLLFEVTQYPRSEQAAFSARFLGSFVAGLFVVGALCVVIDTRDRFRRAVLAFFASALIPVAIGFYQLIGTALGYDPALPFARFLSTDALFLSNFSATVSGTAVPRVPSTLAAPAFFGEFLAFLGVALLAMLLVGRERRPWRVLANVLGLAVILVSLVGTVSRSAWILFALGTLVVLVHARRQLLPAVLGDGRRWVLPATALACLAMLPVFSFSVGDTFSNAIESFRQESADEGPRVDRQYAGTTLTLNPKSAHVNSATASTATHVALREDALELFGEEPVLGVGLGNYGVRVGQASGVSSAQTYGFTVLAEGGVVGLALFLLMLVALVVAAAFAYRARGSDGGWFSAALLGLYVIVLMLVVNNVFLYDTLYLDTSWVVMGLALAGASVVGREAAGSTLRRR